MMYPKIRELIEAVKALIVGPYTAKFPKKPAIVSSKYRGRPTYDLDICIGCGTCANVCPTTSISFNEAQSKDNPYRKFIQDLGKCIFCNECAYQCPVEGALELKPDWDLAALNRQELISSFEKEVLFCTNCDSVIAPIDQLRFLYNKLGASAFSNPTLILSMQESVREIKKQETKEVKHQDVFNLLCPKCRHKVLVKDTWD